MGCAVKWVFNALFGTMSIVKLFHFFEYRKIPQNDSSWRCALYRSTISKSLLQLLSVSIEISNKSSSFRLHHSTNEKLFNVYVSHFLGKQWLGEFVLKKNVLNDREFSIAKQKSNSIQELARRKHLVYTGNRNLICWKKCLKFFWLACIQKWNSGLFWPR